MEVQLEGRKALVDGFFCSPSQMELVSRGGLGAFVVGDEPGAQLVDVGVGCLDVDTAGGVGTHDRDVRMGVADGDVG